MDIPSPVLYRKRLIPSECIRLDQDIILYRDSNIMVTKWIAIHPKPKLTNGYSCYFFDKGIKVSKFYGEGNVFRYWYCDIIKTEYRKEDNSYLFTDLLADVVVFPDGSVRVVDLDEVSEALDQGLITAEETKLLLTQMDRLLNIIYSGGFSGLTQEIESRESNT